MRRDVSQTRGEAKGPLQKKKKSVYTKQGDPKHVTCSCFLIKTGI